MTKINLAIAGVGNCASALLQGLEYYRNVQLSPELEEAAARVQQEVHAEREAEERELEMMRQEGEAEEMAAE